MSREDSRTRKGEFRLEDPSFSFFLALLKRGGSPRDISRPHNMSRVNTSLSFFPRVFALIDGAGPRDSEKDASFFLQTKDSPPPPFHVHARERENKESAPALLACKLRNLHHPRNVVQVKTGLCFLFTLATRKSEEKEEKKKDRWTENIDRIAHAARIRHTKDKEESRTPRRCRRLLKRIHKLLETNRPPRHRICQTLSRYRARACVFRNSKA